MAYPERKRAISAKWDGKSFPLGSRTFESIFGRCRIEITTGGFCEFVEAPTNFRHAHDFYEACLILQGIGEYRFGATNCAIRAGDVIVAS